MTDQGQLHSIDPFAKLPEELLHDVSVPHGAVRLYGHMHWRYNRHQKKNFEGQKSMGEYLDVSTTTIQNWTNELVARDWVVVEYRDRDEKTGNFTTPFYHVFESQEHCRLFREHFEDPQALGAKKPIKERKSRKGKGGFAASENRHRTNTDWYGGTNTDYDGGNNLYCDRATNTDCDESESVLEDDVQKFISLSKIINLKNSKTVMEAALESTLRDHYTRLGQSHFNAVIERCQKRHPKSMDYYLNALRDEQIGGWQGQDSTAAPKELTGQDYAAGEYSAFVNS